MGGSGIDGIRGYFRASFGLGRGFSSRGVSVEEGSVEEELNLAEVEELSVWPLLEVELFVPPLSLDFVSMTSFWPQSLNIPVYWVRPCPGNDEHIFSRMTPGTQRPTLTHAL